MTLLESFLDGSTSGIDISGSSLTLSVDCLDGSIIYKTTNLINGMIYVGQHWTSADDRYLGSGIWFLRAVKKYGKENFKRETLEFCTKNNIDEKEEYWVKKTQARDPKIGYNILKGGRNGYKKDETRIKISNSNKGKICIYSKKYDKIKYISNINELPENYKIGRRPINKKYKKKLSKAKKNKIQIYNEKDKIIKWINKNDIIPINFKQGRGPRSENHNKKLKIALEGKLFYYNKKLDIEKHFKNDDIIPKGFKRGRRPLTKEHNKKVAKTKIKQIKINNIIYNGIMKCLKELNITHEKLQKMIVSGEAIIIKKEKI
jgi:group I intron endonuclease